MTDGDLRGPGGVGRQEEPTETPQAPVEPRHLLLTVKVISSFRFWVLAFREGWVCGWEVCSRSAFKPLRFHPKNGYSSAALRGLGG